MPARLISCRKCGRVCPGNRQRGKGLCEPCADAHQRNNWSGQEFVRNKAIIVAEVRRRQSLGIIVRCPRCELPLNDNITVDHIVPVREGGGHALSNLRPMCSRCNSARR